MPTKNKVTVTAVRDSCAKWVAPKQGFSKINVDVAVSRHGDRRALAGVYMACAEGLALASDLYLQKVQLATDCSATVKNLQGRYLGRNSGSLLKPILHMRRGITIMKHMTLPMLLYL